MPSKRLSRSERRAQMLATARGIVRERGTEALTLASLAEAAGVSKPIAYEHFETRSGLLKALYRDLDAAKSNAVETALKRQRRDLAGVIQILANAHIDCVVVSGREYAAISAALAATQDLEAFRREVTEAYVVQYRLALSAYVNLDGPEGHVLLLGLLGAADQLAAEVANGRLSPQAAVSTLTRIMAGTLAQSSSA